MNYARGTKYRPIVNYFKNVMKAHLLELEEEQDDDNMLSAVAPDTLRPDFVDFTFKRHDLTIISRVKCIPEAGTKFPGSCALNAGMKHFASPSHY